MTVAVAAVPDPERNEMVVIDVNTLTWGELEQIEDLTGRNVTGELGRGQPSAKTMTALIWVVKRRTDPNFTMDDARALTVTGVNVKAPTDPKDPAG